MSETNRTGCVRRITLAAGDEKAYADWGEIATPAEPGVFYAESTFIKPGVWNRIRIDADVIRNGAPSVLGRYLMLNHPDEGSRPAWNDVALAQVVGYKVVEPEAALKVLLKVWEKRIPPEILAKLQSGEKLPVSSGHIAFWKEEAGSFESKPYNAIATKVYFEHVGLVPVGACSLEDGCDAHIVNQSQKGELPMAEDGKEGKGAAEGKGAEGTGAGAGSGDAGKGAGEGDGKKGAGDQGAGAGKGKEGAGDKGAGEGKGKEGDAKTVIQFRYPTIEEKDGKKTITWNSTDKEADAQKALEAFAKGINTTEDVAALKKQVETGKISDQIARNMLMTGLKAALPKTDEKELQKTYGDMQLGQLSDIVTTLNANMPAPAAQDGGDGQHTEGMSTRLTQSPTAQKIQRGGSASAGVGGVKSWPDAKKRIREELGITKF